MFRKTGSIRCSDVTATAKESNGSIANAVATSHLMKGAYHETQRVFVVPRSGFAEFPDLAVSKGRQHHCPEVLKKQDLAKRLPSFQA
jgi:hypothetical protein